MMVVVARGVDGWEEVCGVAVGGVGGGVGRDGCDDESCLRGGWLFVGGWNCDGGC